MLEIDHNLSNTLKPLFLDYQWSPEEIEGRLRLEYGKSVISYQTIYRAIYRGHFDDKLSHGTRGAIRKPRYCGKIRHTQGHVENRGKISISHTIHERPEDANNLIKVIERNAFGFWNFDNFKTRILIALNIKKRKDEIRPFSILAFLQPTTVDKEPLFSKFPLAINSETDNPDG